jgi:hypothetical protein
MWLVPPDIPHAEPIAVGAESNGTPRSYALGRIDTANAVRSGKYVASEYHDPITRLLVCRLVADEVNMYGFTELRILREEQNA